MNLIRSSSSSSSASTAALALLVASSWTLPTLVSSQSTSMDWWNHFLPGCYQAASIFEAAQCFYEYAGGPQCFNGDSASDIASCFGNELGLDDLMANRTNIVSQIRESAITCMEPYKTCIMEQVNVAMDDLAPCIQESTVALANCFYNNIIQCSVSCATAEWSNPFEGQGYYFPTCSKLQENIMDPMCEALSCCEPCLDELEVVAECAVNDFFKVGSLFIDCNFECADRRILGAARRDRNLRVTPYTTTTSNATDIYEECATLAPGITPGNTSTTTEVTTNTVLNADPRQFLARTNYFDCVTEESLAIVDEVVTTSPTSSAVSTTTTTMTTTTIMTMTMVASLLGANLWLV